MSSKISEETTSERPIWMRNAWYVAAFASEVRRSILPRKLLGESIILYRSEAGAPVAMQDRCPHRFAPLSRGKVVQGTLECGYHGLTFDGSGHCVRNPHGPILSNIAVRHYPMIEAYRALWIWMGEPEKADASSIPDFSVFYDHERFATVSGYVRIEANYQLVTDNLLDLTALECNIMCPISRYMLYLD